MDVVFFSGVDGWDKGMRLLVGCDHGALEMKTLLLERLARHPEIGVEDLGCHTPDSVDYPDYAALVCRGILEGRGDRGLLMCGSGIGISMAANRYAGIRAALCHDETTARLSRQHNDANVLVLGGRTTGLEVAAAILEIWLTTPFDGGRHQRRIDKLDTLCCRGKE